MRADPASLHRQSFDFLVIGGGIQGAAIAREFGLRGRSVLLAEQADFGWATSSHSSRLIHGGLRYLEFGHLSLVREALQERERLLRLAPHLVRPLPMLMPFFRDGGRNPFLLRSGLRLYAWLAGRRSSLPAPRYHSADDCVRLFPGLRRQGLRGGSLFFDGRTEDQRLTLAVVEAAQAAGATVCNHLELLGTKGERLLLRDHLGDREIEVRAGAILNAAGHKVDGVRARLGIEGRALVRLSRGSHLVLDPRPTENSLAAFLPDRRIQFVIPHPGGTLCGTTEVEASPTEEDQLGVPLADVDYLLDALGWLLAEPPGRAEVRHGYAAWRALPTARGPAGALNREAFLEIERSAAGPVHTVIGGKLTTHRSFAERVVNQLLDLHTPSPSRDQHLPGGDGPQEVNDPLWWRHGSRAPQLRALAGSDRSLLAPICPHRPFLGVEAVFALRHQAALTLADLVVRRLFHAHGPCLVDSCLDRALDLFLAHGRHPVPVDAAAERAAVESHVQRGLGALAAIP